MKVANIDSKTARTVSTATLRQQQTEFLRSNLLICSTAEASKLNFGTKLHFEEAFLEKALKKTAFAKLLFRQISLIFLL